LQLIAIIVAITIFGTTVNLTYGQDSTNGIVFPTTAIEPFSENEQAYPPPDDNPQKSSINSGYPAPVVPSRPTVKATIAPIPKDRIVAISNTGEIVDFNQNISRLSGKFKTSNNSRFVLPTFSQSQNSPLPL
jgi:hypothetical protein